MTVNMKATDRAIDLTRRFLGGEILTERQISDQYGITRQATNVLIKRIAALIDLSKCGHGGGWSLDSN